MSTDPQPQMSRRSFEEWIAGLSPEALKAFGSLPDKPVKAKRPDFTWTAEMLGLKVHTTPAVREREFVLMTDEVATFYDVSTRYVRKSMSLLRDRGLVAEWSAPEPAPLPEVRSLLDLSAAFPSPGVVS